jgi:hypothetical protein
LDKEEGAVITRYREDIHDIKYNKYNTGFAQHILNSGHEYGNIQDVMTVMK